MTADLIERCKQGDEKAFCELFETHKTMIQKVSWRIVKNSELQKDVVQEVIKLVITNIKGFEGKCLFTTWLYRIIVNVSLKIAEKESVYNKMASFDEVPENLTVRNSNILNDIEKKEMLGHTMEAVMSLSDSYREILSMFYFAEADIKEISEQTGKSISSVKSILFKGRKEIIKNLKKKGLIE